MRLLPALLALFLAATLGLCRADAPDPFALIDPFAPAPAPIEAPRMMRVFMQVIEMPHPALSRLLADPDKTTLHARAFGLTKSGEARVLASSMLVARNGQRATVESVREFIYPVEYQPTCQGLFGSPAPLSPGNPSTAPLPPLLRPCGSTPTAFETRNTGITLEIEATIGDSGPSIDMRIAPEIVDPGKLVTWQHYIDEWGDASIRMPQFRTWRTNAAITLRSGEFRFLTVFSANPNASAPALSLQRLVFLRADIIQLPQPDEP